jgi:hydantoinase/carbamoylase family amidase
VSALLIDPAAVIADLDELAEQSGGRFAGAKRLAWSPQWLRAREWLLGKLSDLGLQADQDAAGNIWAQVDGPGRGFVMVGSHIDAVPSGGWLDGALGVLTALGTMRALVSADAPPPVAVRFVDWADEEGARFGRSLMGSSACAGTLDPDDVRDLTDAEGTSLEDAMSACDVDLDSAPSAVERLEGALAYLELHIEQGPVLLDSDRLAAAVSGTFGVERHVITFTGQAAHAGSTPMRLRRDSLAAAAAAALEIREIGIRHGGVCTVGQMKSTPGVITAVAGRTEMQLDQRHLDPEALAVMFSEALVACEKAAERFLCEVSVHRVFGATPTRFDPRLVEIAREAVAEAGGGDGEAVPSGPLHDATEIGRVVPTVMIFAQSDPPISHTEVEDSPEPALRIAIEAYGSTVRRVLEMAADGQLASTKVT